MADIDDKELEQLRYAARFLASIEAQDGGSKQIQQWAKKINPKVRTEEDIAKEYAAPVIAEVEELKKWKGDLETKIKSYNDDQQWDDVKRTYGYTEDGMKALREFATKNEIKNPKYAAAAWDKENPATPVTSSYLGTQMMLEDLAGGKDTAKRLQENPLKFEEEETRKFMTEIRQQRA